MSNVYKQLVTCWCGCGGTTKSRFVPGHDARFHGRAKRVARGELNSDTELARLPHEEARVEFLRHVEMEAVKLESKGVEVKRAVVAAPVAKVGEPCPCCGRVVEAATEAVAV